MKRCKTYQANQTTGRLNSSRLRGKQQIHTIMHKCHHEGKSAAINKEIARKWRFKAVIHAQEGLLQNPPILASPKRWVSEKPSKYPFFAICCPKFGLFPFRWTIIRKSTLNGLKREKPQKRQFTNFNISFKVL